VWTPPPGVFLPDLLAKGFEFASGQPVQLIWDGSAHEMHAPALFCKQSILRLPQGSGSWSPFLSGGCHMGHDDYLQRILRPGLRLAIESPLDPAPELSLRWATRCCSKRRTSSGSFVSAARAAYTAWFTSLPVELERVDLPQCRQSHAPGVALARRQWVCRAVIVMAAHHPAR